jgi:hypothetical protein
VLVEFGCPRHKAQCNDADRISRSATEMGNLVSRRCAVEHQRLRPLAMVTTRSNACSKGARRNPISYRVEPEAACR